MIRYDNDMKYVMCNCCNTDWGNSSIRSCLQRNGDCCRHQ